MSSLCEGRKSQIGAAGGMSESDILRWNGGLWFSPDRDEDLLPLLVVPLEGALREAALEEVVWPTIWCLKFD